MSHTPGPWKVESDESGLFILMEANADKDDYLAIYASPNPEQRGFDADLIATAPELLEICELMRDALVEANRWTDIAEKATAIIAKARGESS